MKRVILTVLILCLMSLACTSAVLETPGDYVKEFGGDISVYTRILEMTDCTNLKKELERTDELVKLKEPGTQEYKASVGYRTAAENRIKEVECNGEL